MYILLFLWFSVKAMKNDQSVQVSVQCPECELLKSRAWEMTLEEGSVNEN